MSTPTTPTALTAQTAPTRNVPRRPVLQGARLMLNAPQEGSTLRARWTMAWGRMLRPMPPEKTNLFPVSTMTLVLGHTARDVA